MLAHVAGSTEGESRRARPSDFPNSGAAQFVGRGKGFPNFPGRFSRTEENPLYPSDLGIFVRLGQYSFLHSILSHVRVFRLCAHRRSIYFLYNFVLYIYVFCIICCVFVLFGEWRNKYFYSLFKYYYPKFEKLNL